MSVLEGGHPWLGMTIKKKLGKPTSPDPKNIKGIYQTRHRKRGTFTCKMKFYAPTNPQTLPQQLNRWKFSDAIQAWHDLSEEEKQNWRNRAKYKNLYGISLFIREKMYG